MTRTARSFLALTALLVVAALALAHGRNGLQALRLADNTAVAPDTFSEALAAHRFILVGERHTVEGHHQGQLEVIRRLAAQDRPLAIGMEMMRSDSQAYLDAWVAGKLSEAEFQAVYEDNWNYPWMGKDGAKVFLTGTDVSGYFLYKPFISERSSSP